MGEHHTKKADDARQPRQPQRQLTHASAARHPRLPTPSHFTLTFFAPHTHPLPLLLSSFLSDPLKEGRAQGSRSKIKVNPHLREIKEARKNWRMRQAALICFRLVLSAATWGVPPFSCPLHPPLAFLSLPTVTTLARPKPPRAASCCSKPHLKTRSVRFVQTPFPAGEGEGSREIGAYRKRVVLFRSTNIRKFEPRSLRRASNCTQGRRPFFFLKRACAVLENELF